MKTSAIVVIFVILIALIGGIFYFSRQATPDIPNDQDLPVDVVDTADPITATFRDELTRKAIENMGGAMPIEGFDADLLLSAYPGRLMPQDFDGVESFEGIYRYNGTLQYERTADQPVSSAERTVSNEGYETLLRNVSERLELEIEDQADATELVNRLDPS